MATKGKDKLIKGQITFEFFKEEKPKTKNATKEGKSVSDKKFKPIKLKHVKIRKVKGI